MAYAGLASYASQHSYASVDNVPDSIADTYTCYLFQYDGSARVASESVYGQTGSWATTYYTSSYTNGFNNWSTASITASPTAH